MKKISIDCLYLDLSCCERCIDGEVKLDDALTDIAPVLREKGYEAIVKKIKIDAEQKAVEYRLLSSPTIRINGADILHEVKENHCEACGTLCGDGSVTCRTFSYRGKNYDAPPKTIIIEAVLNYINHGKESKMQDTPCPKT